MTHETPPPPDHDEPEILWVLETADRLRRVLQSSEMPPAFREQLRARLLTTHAETVAQPGPAPTAVATRGTVAPSDAGLTDRPATTPDVGTPDTGTADTGTADQDAADRGTAERPPEPPIAPWPTPLRIRARQFTRPRVVALVSAMTAVLAIAAILVARALPVATRPGLRGPVSVTALTDASGVISMDPAQALRLHFSQPLDRKAAEAALRLTPAVKARFTWQGDTLTVTPEHGFAPNAAYLLTISHDVARTATGAQLAADIHVVFGTAPRPGVAKTPAAPAPLPRSQVAGANDGSEAVVTRTGALLLTDARASRVTDQHSGLVRLENGTAFKISAATAAICVSRSGDSIAYLTPAGQPTEIIFADSAGTAQRHIPATVDHGSPLGWIGDAEVSYVSGGRLSAVDRNGHVRTVSDTPVDAAHDRIVIAPGGRYVYLRHPADAAGQLIDVSTGKAHPLPGILDDPAFSADGATVIWVDGSGPVPHLAVAASGGGPVLAVPLPVQQGDKVSDLAVAPGAARFAYSVSHPDGRAELRLAALTGGETLAVSADGAGGSPNWAASGQQFTVLSQSDAGPRIDLVTVPASVTDLGESFEASAAAYANAQLSGDAEAQRSLAGTGVTVPQLPHVTRAAVLWVQQSADGTATALVRFTVDPPSGQVAVQQAEVTLSLGPGAGDRPPLIRGVTAGPFGPAPAGPQLVHLDTRASPGTASLAFDSDLDPASVTAGISLSTESGAQIPATATYDASNRTVTVRPAVPTTAPLVVRVGGGLRDIDGRALSGELRIRATLSS